MKKWTSPTMTILTSSMIKSEVSAKAYTCIRFFVR